MFFRESQIERFIEEKTRKAMHDIECYKDHMIAEMGGIDKYTLCNLRKILAKYEDISGKLPYEVSKYMRDNDITIGEIRKFLSEQGDYNKSNSEAINRFNETLLAMRESTNLAMNSVTPESFGAVGDGVTDDTEALQTALALSVPVFLKGTYLISNQIIVNSPHIYGNNSTIIANANASTVLRLSGNNIIDDLVINCNDKSISYAIYSENNDNFIGRNIHISNIFGNPSRQSTGIRIKNGNIVLSNIFINSVYAVINGTEGDGDGSAYGVMCGGFDYFSITDFNISEIHSCDSDKNIVFEDSGAIYVSGSPKDSYCSISNGVFRNSGKYGIKTQTGNVKIKGVTGYNSLDDLKTLIVTLPTSGTDYNAQAIIENCELYDTRETISNNSLYMIETHIPTQIKNCNFDSLTMYACGVGGETVVDNCTIRGCGFVADHAGITIKNTCFNGRLFLYAKHNCTIENCNIIFNEYGTAPKNYSPLYTSAACTFRNCVIDCYKYATISPANNATLTFNKCFFVCRSKFGHFNSVGGSTIKLVNCSIESDGTTSSYLMVANGTIVFDNVSYTGSHPLADINANPIIRLKNTPLSYFKFLSSSVDITNTPCYEETLPTVKPENLYIILLSDGKLYKSVSGEWVAQN